MGSQRPPEQPVGPSHPLDLNADVDGAAAAASDGTGGKSSPGWTLRALKVWISNQPYMAIFISFVPVLALAIGLAAIVRPADRLQLIDAPTLAFAGFAVALTAFGRLTERGEAASSWAAVTLALAFIQAITATTLLVNHNRYIPTREQAEYAMDVALGPASRPTDSKSIGQLYDSFNNIKHLAEPIGSGWVAFCAAVAGISLLLLIALWQTKQAIATLVSKR